MTPSKQEGFFYAQLYLGNARWRTWDWSAILDVGIHCWTRGRIFSPRHPCREHYRFVRHRVLRCVYGSGRGDSCVAAVSAIFNDRRVWRLHDVFVVQLTNVRFPSRWGLVEGVPQHSAVVRLLPRSRMAWAYSCSHPFAEIERTLCKFPKTPSCCGFSSAKAIVIAISRCTRRLS